MATINARRHANGAVRHAGGHSHPAWHQESKTFALPSAALS
jgi:hypothetical protein